MERTDKRFKINKQKQRKQLKEPMNLRTGSLRRQTRSTDPEDNQSKEKNRKPKLINQK